MKNYEPLEMTLITFTQDVVRTSGEASGDNQNGVGDWE